MTAIKPATNDIAPDGEIGTVPAGGTITERIGGADVALPVTFPMSPASPSADGCDIAGEREALADLMAADNVDANDPRWARFAQLCDPEEAPRPVAQGAARRPGAHSLVRDHVARRIAGLGQLTDVEPDTMTLHTKDAFRIFTGQRADSTGKTASIAGGQCYAAVLKCIWYLSANDNPYADWILIRTYDALKALRAHLARLTQARTDAIEVLKRKGLTFCIMGATKPRTVALGFRSPYGYCEETGEPIGLPRLLARPTAELTVEAQERRERRKIVGTA